MRTEPPCSLLKGQPPDLTLLRVAVCDKLDQAPEGATRSGGDPMPGNGQMIIALDRKRMQAMADKDIATLRTVLADDLIYTHSSARLDSKQSLIGAMESGATVYTAVEPSDVKSQDLGDAVVLTGVAAISVMSNGKPNSFRVRFTDVYTRRDGKWQMVTWQSTRLVD
jgi:ketosteroid isomerase-like protein